MASSLKKKLELLSFATFLLAKVQLGAQNSTSLYEENNSFYITIFINYYLKIFNT